VHAHVSPVAQYPADAQPNRPLAEKYGIQSFPTLKFFPKGSSEPVAYEGGRSEVDFINFLNENCGTYRAVGGGLNDKAGRVPELDTLASKFASATADTRSSIHAEALLLQDTVGAAAKHYFRVMEKVVNGTDGYLEKEAKR
jgi:protein disulfide-isomerase A6